MQERLTLGPRVLVVPTKLTAACEWGIGPTDVSLQGTDEGGKYMIYLGLTAAEAVSLAGELLLAAEAAARTQRSYDNYMEEICDADPND